MCFEQYVQLAPINFHNGLEAMRGTVRKMIKKKKDGKLSIIGLVGSTQVRNSETLSDTEKKRFIAVGTLGRGKHHGPKITRHISVALRQCYSFSLVHRKFSIRF